MRKILFKAKRKDNGETMFFWAVPLVLFGLLILLR